ncbi:methyltransferase, FxLD system [Actinomadura litoris]|uniref:methyltransferase, FxLD system n=1 Tax=Actinomadura litoris TaxID=2678616 RepID=UPI001FA7E3A7|nr:methyltransferase, FxLD system [Actinomadura litoris]
MTDACDSIGVDEPSGDQIAFWRGRAVDQLIGNGTIVSDAVATAMWTVPRHLFVPEVSPEEAYAPFQAVVTKRDEEGNALSSVSDMHVQAFMLEQAAIAPGMNVLEIGSGGYNAALLAELVGPSGAVTTADIDPYVTDRATRMLDGAGYSRVNVVLADAEAGVPAYAPYDRILVTMGAWDIPPAWPAQLADGGCICTALRIRGLHRVITFERADGCLVSTASRMFGFVAVQGVGAHQATLLVMRRGEVTLRFDDGTDLDPGLFEGVFATPCVEVWSGAFVGLGEFLDTLQMWLATAFPNFCMVLVDQDRDTGVVAPRNASSAMAVVDDAGNLAYLTTRPATEDGRKAMEYGVHAYGPDAARLAELVAEQLRVWSREHRGGPGPQYRIYPAGTPDDLMPHGRVVEKTHSRVSISWPQTATAVAGQGFSASPVK